MEQERRPARISLVWKEISSEPSATMVTIHLIIYLIKTKESVLCGVHASLLTFSYTHTCNPVGGFIRRNVRLIKDIQRSTTSLVKEDGTAHATYQYTDFGKTTVNGDNKAENEVCYTGGIYDSTTGLPGICMCTMRITR